MPFMLLYLDIGSRKRFDPEKIGRTLIDAGAVECRAPGEDCVAVFDYELAPDITTIRIPSGLATVDLDGTGPASLDIAWRIQKDYAEPIHLIDEQYTFDFVIRDFDSLESLTQAANKAMNE